MIFLWILCSVLLLHERTLSEELYNFGEGCPKDSILTDAGTCKCDLNTCKKPPCMFDLKLVTEATDIPGSCCPTYSCEGCKKIERFEGQCPCASGAVLISGQKCICIDRHKKLINNTCVCDVNKCELPDMCDERSVLVKEMDGCCEKSKCVPCPEDSYVNSYNDFVLEDMCVCLPCPVTRCNETHTPQILRRGRNTPGACCDIYKCVSIGTSLGCMVNETLYNVGETWTSSGDTCECRKNGITFCSHPNPTNENHSDRSCLSDTKVYNHLDTWLLEDACTKCTCDDGEVKCIAHMCDIATSEMKKSTTVCLPLTACHKVCTSGYRLNKAGCKTCECNDVEVDDVSFDEYYQFKQLLKKHNVTGSAIIDIIKTLGLGGNLQDVTTTTATMSPSTTTSTKSPVVPLTGICSTNNNTPSDCAYSCLLEYALPGFVIGTILGTILVLTFRRCFEKNRKKYTMYMPVGKEAAPDKNLTLSSIIKQNTKNFELQNYNEKKNAI